MIGERLEEARKRKGLTVREVAEATKIRGDFLSLMEANKFDIGLPGIYVRGFLKNYARFLGLDPEKILTDYDAHQLGRSAHTGPSTRPHKEALGHMEISRPAAAAPARSAAPAEAAPPVLTEPPQRPDAEPDLKFNLNRRSRAVSAESEHSIRDKPGSLAESWGENRELYLKIGLGVAGLVLILLVIVILARLTGSGDANPELNPELTATSGVRENATPAPQAAITTDTLVVLASDNVTLMIEQTLNRERLFSGTLNAGERISVRKEGPVSIRFSNGSAITIERNGEQFRPAQAGVGRTLIQ